MGKSDIIISYENEELTLLRKKYKNTTYLSFYKKVSWDGITKISHVDSRQNIIQIHDEIKKEFAGKYCTLVNTSNGKFMDVIIADSNASSGNINSQKNQITFTSSVEKILEANADSELIICKQNYCQFDVVGIQAIEDVRTDVVSLPQGTFIESVLNDFCLFEIINPLTNDSIYIRSKYIKIDPKQKRERIRINRKHRNMLSDNIPTRLTIAQWNAMIENGQTNQDAKEALESTYTKEDKGYIIKQAIDEIDFNSKNLVKKCIKDNLGECLIIRPVLESFHYEKKEPLHRKISDFYVGKSTLSLNCRRPHECDENSDIVRMTENNMQFLGIEPMDRVIIRYKETEAVCQVLPFCEEKYRRTNTPGIIEQSIGIPVHIRGELNIPDIQSSVKVDRDTVFIFKKNINEQLVPIILTILSLKFFEQIPWHWSVILLIILVPIVMYVALSPQRNKRGK